MLAKEREANQIRIDEVVKEHNAVAQQLLLSTGNRESSELRGRRNELVASRDQLDVRSKWIDSILERLPDARDKVVKNEEFRFEYSLFLLPKEEEDDDKELTEDNEELTASDDKLPPRLRNEDSLRLMETK